MVLVKFIQNSPARSLFLGFMAFDWKEGGYDGDAFLSAMELTICPHLQRYVKGSPNPNVTFILDNFPALKKHEAGLREGRALARGVAAAWCVVVDVRLCLWYFALLGGGGADEGNSAGRAREGTGASRC